MTTIRETGPPPVHTWPPRACAGIDTRLFFPGKEGGGREAGVEQQAKAVCRRCAAQRFCRAYAIPIADLSGVWGSMNENERARVRKARQQKEA